MSDDKLMTLFDVAKDQIDRIGRGEYGAPSKQHLNLGDMSNAKWIFVGDFQYTDPVEGYTPNISVDFYKVDGALFGFHVYRDIRYTGVLVRCSTDDYPPQWARGGDRFASAD